jgi:ketosteroid isomerase-like protein
VAEIDWKRELQEGAEAYNRGDWEGVLTRAAEDIVLQRAPSAPEGRALVEGREAVLEFFRPNVLNEQRLELLEFTQGDDVFLARMKFSARGAGSDLPVALNAFLVYRIEGDLLTRIEIHNDEAPARAAAGLA